jgi:hypothetical protein
MIAALSAKILHRLAIGFDIVCVSLDLFFSAEIRRNGRHTAENVSMTPIGSSLRRKRQAERRVWLRQFNAIGLPPWSFELGLSLRRSKLSQFATRSDFQQLMNQ